MALSCFPAELWDKVLEFASNDTLVNTRRVSRFHRESSDRVLFRAITLRNSKASAEWVRKVLASQRLKHHVRILHVDPRPASLVPSDQSGSPLQALVPEFRHTLSDMYYHPTVSSFILDFERYNPPKYVWPVVRSFAMDAFRSDLLCFFLTTFTFSRYGLSRSPMRALSLRHLQSRCEDHVTESPGFSDLVNNLHTLELSFLTVEHECGRPHNRPIGPQSWNFYTTLPQVWLAPARQLTKLRLSADSHWGYYPKVDFRDVSFGSLKTLVLDRFTFSHDWQQVWLLQHRTTLTNLVLSRCSILREAFFVGDLDQDGYPTGLGTGLMLRDSVTYTYNAGWSDCLKAMNDSLTELRYFSIIGENHKSAVAEEMTTVTQADRYLDFKCGIYSAVIDRKFHGAAVDLSSHISQMAIAPPVSLGTNHLLAMSRQYQEDAQALRDLLNKIAQRNTAIGK